MKIPASAHFALLSILAIVINILMTFVSIKHLLVEELYFLMLVSLLLNAIEND